MNSVSSISFDTRPAETGADFAKKITRKIKKKAIFRIPCFLFELILIVLFSFLSISITASIRILPTKELFIPKISLKNKTIRLSRHFCQEIAKRLNISKGSVENAPEWVQFGHLFIHESFSSESACLCNSIILVEITL